MNGVWVPHDTRDEIVDDVAKWSERTGIAGTFSYLCTVLEGYPPTADFIVHWEIREAMTEQDIQILLQRAREKFPDARPRIISDNPPAADTSPYYPQSNPPRRTGTLSSHHQARLHSPENTAVAGREHTIFAGPTFGRCPTANSIKPEKGGPPPGKACVRPPDSLANSRTRPHAVVTG
jgi:hypothetical protein